MDNQLERLIDTLRRKYSNQHIDELNGDGWLGSNTTPDEDFLQELAELAPVMIDRWTKYMDAGGDLTLDQAFFGEGNYALRKANAATSANKDYAFLHWLHLERMAFQVGKPPPNLGELARLYDADNWTIVAEEYRAYRAGISGLPPLVDQ